MVKRATLLGETLAHLEECQLESVCAALPSPSWRIRINSGSSTEALVLFVLGPRYGYSPLNVTDASLPIISAS